MKPHQLRALCLAASVLVALACYWGLYLALAHLV